MFAKKKSSDPPKKRSRDLSQFGLFEIPDNFDPSGGMGQDDGNDSDFEAELAAITSGQSKPKPKPKKKEIIPPSELDKMVAESLRDIGDDEISDDDDDDPALLGELQEITGDEVAVEQSDVQAGEPEEKEQIFLPTTTVSTIEVIKQRIEMYQLAEQQAKAAGEAGRARRFNRGLKTLNDLLKQAMAGKDINSDDIPPEVAVKKPEPAADVPSPASPPPAAPARPAPAIPSPPKEQPPSPQSTEPEKPENPKIAILNARLHEYKVAALGAKRSGDTESAIQFVKIIKQFDMVIKAAKEGQEVDLSDMPPPPSELKAFLEKMQQAANEVPQPQPEPAQPEPAEAPPGLVTSSSLGEALQQRLEKYKSTEAAAKAEGNTSKARRYGRIVKQYEDAIKAHKAGRPVPVDELPTPPGFGPLPTGDAPQKPSPSIPPKPAAATTPGPSPKPQPASPPLPSSPEVAPKPKAPLRKQESTTRMSGNHVGTTLMEKQMQILTQRQNEFKVAAIEAKKAGEIEQAKEYLKIYKGFESLLNAASCGLPVDMNTLPIPPSQRANLEDSFAFVNEADCDENDDISDISVRLEEQLAKQLMMCKNTRDHHKAMGDVAGMNRFENLALTVQKDLDLVRYSRRKNLSIPKFHYEQKSFNIVHCNTDLTDNEVEVVIVRGIQYNVPNPKEVDTYVKIEFPYPQDDPFKAKTNLVKNTDSPDYDQNFKVDIQRSNRQCQRQFKRHSAKFEVYSRGGFLRSDILIGTVTVKLQPLETKCEIHDTFNLMEGRKAVGGQLELKIRLRNPIVAKQIEHINEKWLIIDT